MNALLDPVGFIADSIAIANAFGFYTSAQKAQSLRLMDAIDDARSSAQLLEQRINEQAEDIQRMVTTSSAIEVHSRLREINDIPPEKIELLIKLLFYVKQVASNVVFAIIVKYRVGRTVATLGFAGASADEIEGLVKKTDDFCRAISHVSKEKTTYVNVRVRGKFKVEIENACTSALTAIATEICALSRNIELSTVNNCALEAAGAKTVTLLQPAETCVPASECDRLCRIFLVGDTRSGKSTLGNAVLQQGLFSVSKGMTGTMRIQHGERCDYNGGELLVTEIYDTPGLNDKDGLDIFYLTAIEDHIRMLQRASALIMTVSAEAGITSSAFKSLAAYKVLFGQSIASMLIVVLTINEPADASDLDELLDLNWPTVSAMGNRIRRQNVFCLSLHDLREDQGTASHKIVEDISEMSCGMPMKVIDALQKRYQNLRESLAQTSTALRLEMQEVMDGGWMQYDYLTARFEASPYVKLTDEEDGTLDGFVMKGTSSFRKLIAVGTAGVLNTIRKTAIHVRCEDKSSEYHWMRFLKENESRRNSHDLMKSFGDALYSNGLGVTVKEMRMTLVGTLRVRRYKLRVFDPINSTQGELRIRLQELLSESSEELEDELRPEILHDLARSVLPRAVRCVRKKISLGKK